MILDSKFDTVPATHRVHLVGNVRGQEIIEVEGALVPKPAHVRPGLDRSLEPRNHNRLKVRRSIGDAYDNALAESTIGLFKNEAIRDDSPFRNGPLKTLDEVEWVTMAWVDWYNSRRLHSTLGDVPPDEFEASYYAALKSQSQPEMEPA